MTKMSPRDKPLNLHWLFIYYKFIIIFIYVLYKFCNLFVLTLNYNIILNLHI